MSNTTNPSKHYSPTVYKYFGENSLTDINNELLKYKKNPKDLNLLEELGKHLNMGLKKLKKDKENLPEGNKKNDLDLIEGYIEKLFLKSIKGQISKDIIVENRRPRNGNNGNNLSRNGSNRDASTEEKEALKKIGIIDRSLEPGLVKKYFKDESLTDMFLKIKAILRSPIKEQAKI